MNIYIHKEQENLSSKLAPVALKVETLYLCRVESAKGARYGTAIASDDRPRGSCSSTMLPTSG